MLSKFFYLQKTDRKVIVILLCVIVAALTVLIFTEGRQEESTLKQVSTDKENKYKKKSHRTASTGSKQPKAERFYFDPNTADSSRLLRLGLQSWQVSNIMKYRRAGGVFRKPRDFARLYGLTLKQYQQLEPYIRIKEEPMAADYYFNNDNTIEERDTSKYPIKITSKEHIILNHADTTQLRKVPGIGPYFARKIVEYRQRLGGYYDVAQLLEIEDFPKSAITYFVIPNDTALRKMNLNKLSLKELKRHPYINFYQARKIVEFRRVRGHIESLQQLGLDKDFSPEAIKRLEPYVEY